MIPNPSREPIHRGLGRMLWRFAPRPIPHPELDQELMTEPWLTRAAEVLRYWIARIEHALSPGGVLREWIKLCLRAAAAIGVPALILLPIAVGISGGLADLTAAIVQLCINVLEIIGIIAVIVMVVMFLFG